jgi:hypothetical protein
MNKQNYHCSLSAEVSAHEAFQKISQVSDWWTSYFKGKAESLNDEFTVTFGKTFVDFKIVEVIPDKKVVWKVINCYLHWLNDKTEWNNTRLVWEIKWENNITTIDITHEGLSPEVECYDSCVKGWDFYLKQSLAKLLKEGKGLPEKIAG